MSACLQNALSLREVDVDALIVQDQNLAIKTIFETFGEGYFRDCESRVIAGLDRFRQAVISCGGGAVVREENVENLKRHSCLVLLTASPETIFERVKNSDERPVLNGNMNVDYIKMLMEKRAAAYEKAADITVSTDGKSVEAVCEEIIKALAVFDRKKEGTKTC